APGRAAAASEGRSAGKGWPAGQGGEAPMIASGGREITPAATAHADAFAQDDTGTNRAPCGLGQQRLFHPRSRHVPPTRHAPIARLRQKPSHFDLSADPSGRARSPPGRDSAAQFVVGSGEAARLLQYAWTGDRYAAAAGSPARR